MLELGDAMPLSNAVINDTLTNIFTHNAAILESRLKWSRPVSRHRAKCDPDVLPELLYQFVHCRIRLPCLSTSSFSGSGRSVCLDAHLIILIAHHVHLREGRQGCHEAQGTIPSHVFLPKAMLLSIITALLSARSTR